MCDIHVRRCACTCGFLELPPDHSSPHNLRQDLSQSNPELSNAASFTERLGSWPVPSEAEVTGRPSRHQYGVGDLNLGPPVCAAY